MSAWRHKKPPDRPISLPFCSPPYVMSISQIWRILLSVAPVGWFEQSCMDRSVFICMLATIQICRSWLLCSWFRLWLRLATLFDGSCRALTVSCSSAWWFEVNHLFNDFWFMTAVWAVPFYKPVPSQGGFSFGYGKYISTGCPPSMTCEVCVFHLSLFLGVPYTLSYSCAFSLLCFFSFLLFQSSRWCVVVVLCHLRW